MLKESAVLDKLLRSPKIILFVVVGIVAIVALSRYIQIGNVNAGSGAQTNINNNITIPNEQNGSFQAVVNNGSNNTVNQTMK